MISKKNELLINALKTGTYTILGTVSAYTVMLIQGGTSLKEALFLGLATGILAGLKNFAKYQFDLDLDLTKLNK